MEKNIVEVVTNNKGEVIEKVADYIGVASFAKTIENLYRECLDSYYNAEDIEEYIADCCGKNIQTLAWEFALKANREMKKYLHLPSQRMPGNFADLYMDYPHHRTGTFWAFEYEGSVSEYLSLYILIWLLVWMPQRIASWLTRTERILMSGISKLSARLGLHTISATTLQRLPTALNRIV